MVLAMYDIENYWVFGLCSSSISETRSVSILRSGAGDTSGQKQIHFPECCVL
jgi:hypothetical protein